MNLQYLVAVALKSRHDEDFIDKFNNKLTSYLMFALGLSAFAQEYAGAPVKCWSKPSWYHSWLQYVEDYCFIEGTYAIKIDAPLPPSQEMDQHKHITFYQWIPFIFYLMGIMLQLPRFFWSFINWTSYLHLTGFCNVAVDCFRQHPVQKNGEIEAYVNHFEDAINRKCRKTKERKRISYYGIVDAWNTHVSSKYLYISYLGLKLWQIVNNVLLFIILNRLIADQWGSDIFGFSTFSTLWSGTPWTQSDIFPRVTVCNFLIREMGKGNVTEMASKSAQCVLAAHMFVEKFFMFAWIWLVVLLVCNLWALCIWCYRFFFCVAENFLKEYIQSGIDFVDFMKHENEKRRKQAEEKKKEFAELVTERQHVLADIAAALKDLEKINGYDMKAALKDLEAALADNGDKNGGGNGSSSKDGKVDKEMDADKTVLEMEPRLIKREKNPLKNLKAIDARLEELQQKNKMTEVQKNEFIEKQKRFYEINIDTSLRAFRKNLGLDGLLTLYMIAINASSAVAARIISQFFFDFITEIQAKQQKEVKDFPPSYDGFKKNEKACKKDEKACEKDVLDSFFN